MELKITYGITVKNELEEIKKLLPFLIKNIREEDDIVVLWDSRDGTDEMVNFLTSLEMILLFTKMNFKDTLRIGKIN